MLASYLSAWAVRCLDAGFLQLFVASAFLMIDACCRSAFAAECEPPRLRSTLALASSSPALPPGGSACFFCRIACISARRRDRRLLLPMSPALLAACKGTSKEELAQPVVKQARGSTLYAVGAQW